MKSPRSLPVMSRGGFTLIELLTVVAIIGILAAILIPTVSGARVAANKARTRAQFAQWSAAFELFRQEYGHYPQLSANAAPTSVNAGASSDEGQEHLFHDVLAGRRRDPSAASWLASRPSRNPPHAEVQNPRRIRFLNFSESDFVTAGDVSAGRNTAAELNLVRDAFHNTSIAIVADTNLDGVINGLDAAGGFPAVTPPGGGEAIRPIAGIPVGTSGGIRAGVIFYSAPTGAVTESDLVRSWK